MNDHTHDINEISGAYEKADRHHDHDLSELWSYIRGLREDLSEADRHHDHDLSELWSYIRGLREDLSAAENRITDLEQAAR